MKYSITHNEWSKISVPSEIYASYSVLTTYLSKLLLISGQNGTVWEFDCNRNVFKESCIESIPDYSMSFVATSQDNYLIVAPDTLHFYSYDHDCAICVHIFDGTSWIILQYDPILLGSNEKCISIIGNHIIYEVKF